jgi:hypothetical protein
MSVAAHSEEDEVGQAVVAVSLAVAAAYPHQDTCQSSTCEKHDIPNHICRPMVL